MLTYNVTYPNSREWDVNVPWSYLERLSGSGKDGARATCTNGEVRSYVLQNGRWWEDEGGRNKEPI